MIILQMSFPHNIEKQKKEKNEPEKKRNCFIHGWQNSIYHIWIYLCTFFTNTSDLIQKIKQKFTWYTILKKTILCKIHANKKYPNSI